MSIRRWPGDGRLLLAAAEAMRVASTPNRLVVQAHAERRRRTGAGIRRIVQRGVRGG